MLVKTYECNMLAPYSHPIIAEILKKKWFSSKKAKGAVYKKNFDPIPLVLIALIATVV